MNFPEPLRKAITELIETDDLYFFSAEERLWGDTAMGLSRGGFSGQAMTDGWVVTLKYVDRIEVWHVSNYGHAMLASREEPIG